MLTKETKVGLFVLGGIIVFMFGIVVLGDFHFQRRYKVHILFDDIAGLPDKAPVKIAGVEVGKVKEINLQNNKAKVTVWINNKIKIHEDTRASIIATGIIGTKYLEMTLGSPDLPLLKDGDTIVGINPLSLDKIIAQVAEGFSSLIESLKSLGGEELGKDLKNILKNTSGITEVLNRVLQSKEINLAETIDYFHDFSKDIRKVAGDLEEITSGSKEDLKTTLKKLGGVVDKLDAALTSVAEISQSIEKGDGVLGKLFSDKEMGEQVKEAVGSLKETARDAQKVLRRIAGFKTYWDYQLRSDLDDDISRSDFGLRIYPKEDKFYYLGMNNIGEKGSDEGGQKRNTFTAELGHDFGPWTLSAGVIRSKGGLGLNYRPFPSYNWFNRLSLKAEVFDFGRKVVKGTENKNKAWLNTGLCVRMTKWLYLSADVEDSLEGKNFNANLNLVIEDEDIAYLLGLVGLARL
ncbi:MAG: MlaD family protein [Elusimicrobiota bacterium]